MTSGTLPSQRQFTINTNVQWLLRLAECLIVGEPRYGSWLFNVPQEDPRCARRIRACPHSSREE
jgi:hypothetical protein